MISEEYIIQKLQQFISSKNGEEIVKEKYPDYKNQLTELAKELRNKIVNAYNQATSVYARKMGVGKIHVGISKIDKRSGEWVIDVVFPSDLLKRDSLTGAGGVPTGSGVYDIFGLITQGYPKIHSVVGVWEGRNSGLPISNKRVRSPNSFISDTINDFEMQHPGVKVDYPRLWGGMDSGIL